MAKKIKKKNLLEDNNPLDAKKKKVVEGFLSKSGKKNNTPRMRIDAIISFDVYQKLNELVFLKSMNEKRSVSKREIIEEAIELYYQKYKEEIS